MAAPAAIGIEPWPSLGASLGLADAIERWPGLPALLLLLPRERLVR